MAGAIGLSATSGASMRRVRMEAMELKSVKQRIAISIIPFTLRAGAPIYKIGLFIEGIGS